MEKRAEVRLRRHLLVRFIHDQNVHHSFTADLSPHGMFIQTPYVYPTGSAIDIEVHHQESRIALQGRIAWNKKVPISSYLILKGGMGVEILNPQNPEFLSLLDH